MTERPPRRVLATLCVTVTISYGTLYYAFAVLAPTISSDTGWSLAAITAAFSAGSLATGVVGIPAGRAIQAGGPRTVMVAGGCVGSAGLLLVAIAPTYPLFLLAMVVCGAGAAGLFYAPAFAAITHWYGARRVEALTALTLVAGFASTIFAPTTTLLAERTSWRTTYVVFAVLLLVVAVPLHHFALRLAWQPMEAGRHAGTDRDVVTSAAFVLVAIGFTLATLAMYASIVAFVPLLIERDLTPGLAAWALGLGGAGQVVGRLAYPAFSRVLGLQARVGLTTFALAVTIAVFAVVPGPASLLVLGAVVAGAARGLFTLVGALLVTDLWGPERYAALNGVLGAPVALATAIGPFVGAGLADVAGGYPVTFAVLGGIAALGAVLSVSAVGMVER